MIHFKPCECNFVVGQNNHIQLKKQFFSVVLKLLRETVCFLFALQSQLWKDKCFGF